MHFARHYGPFVLVAFLFLGAWGQYNSQRSEPYEQAVLIEVDKSLSVERVHQSEFRAWLKKYVQRKSGQKGGIVIRSCTEFWAVPGDLVGTPQLKPILNGRDHVALDYSPLSNGKSVLAIMTQ